MRTLLFLVASTIVLAVGGCADHTEFCRAYEYYMQGPNARVSWETHRKYYNNCDRPVPRLSF